MMQMMHDYTELTIKCKVWRTHMRAGLSGQKGGQGLPVPVVGIQIHKYDRPGAALQSRNTVKRWAIPRFTDETPVLHMSEERNPWQPNGSTWKPLTCEQQRYWKINQTFGILLPEQQSGKSPSASPRTFPMRLLQRSSPQHLNTSRQVRRGLLLLLHSCGSGHSFLALKRCSALLHPSISTSDVNLA